MKEKLFITGLFCALAISGIKAQSGYINTYAGNGSIGYSGDGGPATAAEIWPITPSTISMDKSGNVYIADYGNDEVRRVSTSGIIVKVAGNYGNAISSGDGLPATSALVGVAPYAVCVDKHGNFYISDETNINVRKVSYTGIITTYAGNGTQGFSGDGGTATNAELEGNEDIALDDSDNLYITQGARIRKVDARTQVITTFAGNGVGGWFGDGGVATSAEISVANFGSDTVHNILYFSDGTTRIRAININTNIITTVAGNGTVGSSGDGYAATAAEFSSPKGIGVDAAGNIYIADEGNAKIREITVSNGIVNSIAGTGTIGFYGDGGPAISAYLWEPSAVGLDQTGNIFIADDENYRVRKVNALTTGVNQVKNATGNVTVYPNPNNGSFTLSLVNTTDKCNVEIFNILGEKVLTQSLLTTKGNHINISSQSAGVYIYKVLKVDGSIVGEGKLILE